MNVSPITRRRRSSLRQSARSDPLRRSGDARAARLGARRLAGRRRRRGRARQGSRRRRGARRSFAERRRVLGALLAYTVEHKEEICAEVQRGSGKTRENALLGEIWPACEKLRWTIGNGEKHLQAGEGLVGPAGAQEGAPRVSPARRRRRDHPVELSVPEHHQPDHSGADGGQRHRAQAVGVGGVVERALRRGAARVIAGRGSRSEPHPGRARLRRDRRGAGALRRRHDPVHRLGRQRPARRAGERRARDAGGDGARRQGRVHRLRRRRSRAGGARGDERLLHQLRTELRRVRAHPRARRGLRCASPSARSS